MKTPTETKPTAHSPLPWKIDQGVRIVNDDMRCIADLCIHNARATAPRPEAEANARHIVRCVNAHDELVRLVEHAMKLEICAMHDFDPNSADYAACKVNIERYKTAIRNATCKPVDEILEIARVHRAANAAHIVRCVNAFPELVKALEDAQFTLEQAAQWEKQPHRLKLLDAAQIEVTAVLQRHGGTMKE